MTPSLDDLGRAVMSLFLALSRHAVAVAACRLLGDERTSIIRFSKSHFDPERTSRSHYKSSFGARFSQLARYW
jgi:hypothetical protein